MNRVMAMALVLTVPWCRPASGAPEGAGTPAEWLGMLASPEFEVREKGCEQLAQWAEENTEEARELFLDQVADHEDPEVRMRCRELLRESVINEYQKKGQGFVGIEMAELQLKADAGFGVKINAVRADTPAEKAGLLVGDVIVGMEGQQWKAPGAMTRFREEVMSRHPGDKVRLKILRMGEPDLLDVEVELALRPPGLERLLLWQGLRQDPEELLKQQQEARVEEEKLFFEHWLEKRLRLRRGEGPVDGPR